MGASAPGFVGLNEGISLLHEADLSFFFKYMHLKM
jgi:hypothetical protein